ncbi:MAG: hypothetical protein QM754_14655 [Tepidisphaeraceae bacterium]
MLIAIWDTAAFLFAALDNGRPTDASRLRDALRATFGETACEKATDSVIDLHLPENPTVDAAVLKLGIVDAADLLAKLELTADLSPSVRFWAVLARIARDCVVHQQFYPSIRREGDSLTAIWQPLIGNKDEVLRLEKFAASLPAVCRAVPLLKDAPPASSGRNLPERNDRRPGPPRRPDRRIFPACPPAPGRH